MGRIALRTSEAVDDVIRRNGATKTIRALVDALVDLYDIFTAHAQEIAPLCSGEQIAKLEKIDRLVEEVARKW